VSDQAQTSSGEVPVGDETADSREPTIRTAS
jgi:hypothetical protein